jgi:hypothetical protein
VLTWVPDDDFNYVTLPSATEPSGSCSTKTTWTLLLYLTSAAEGCIGGETVFYPHDRKVAKEAIAVAPETGMLLLHKHGNDCLLVSQTWSPPHRSVLINTFAARGS